MPDAPDVLLVLGGERWPMRREVALGVLTRSTVLLAEGRTEVARLPLDTEPSAVLHLVLGAQSIVLLEEGAVADPADLITEPEPAESRSAPLHELFPAVGEYLRDA